MNPEEALQLIAQGENAHIEFKSGKYLIRVGSTNRTATKEELSRLFQQAGLVHFDIAPVSHTGFKDLEQQALDEYFQTYYDLAFVDLEQEEQIKLLCNVDLLTEFEETITTTIGGLLLFGKQPQRYLPQAAVSFALFKGDSITDELLDKKELTGTLPQLIDNCSKLVQLFLPVASNIEGLQRQEQHLLPLKVIREAIVNAVAHRDYSMSNRKTSVYLFNNRLEITSAGRLPNTLTLDKIRYGNSAPRNMLLVKFLDNLRYFDGLGRGVPMMIKFMGDNIQFQEIGELFRITLFFKP